MWVVYYRNYEVLMRCEAFDLAYLKRVARDSQRILDVFDDARTFHYKIYPGGRVIESSQAAGTLRLPDKIKQADQRIAEFHAKRDT